MNKEEKIDRWDLDIEAVKLLVRIHTELTNVTGLPHAINFGFNPPNHLVPLGTCIPLLLNLKVKREVRCWIKYKHKHKTWHIKWRVVCSAAVRKQWVKLSVCVDIYPAIRVLEINKGFFQIDFSYSALWPQVSWLHRRLMVGSLICSLKIQRIPCLSHFSRLYEFMLSLFFTTLQQWWLVCVPHWSGTADLWSQWDNPVVSTLISLLPSCGHCWLSVIIII